MVIVLYNLVLLIAVGVLGPVWIPLVILRQKYRDTFVSRLFMAPLGGPGDSAGLRGSTRRIWIHALSVGEVLSAEPLVRALSRKWGAEQLIFSASTATGIATARRVIAPHVAAVKPFPYDTMLSVRRALAVVQPRQVVIVETDIWPNFLFCLKQRRIPVYLVNARLSDRSYRGYKRMARVMKPLLSVFRCILVQTDRDRRRFLDLGVPGGRLLTVGNIKFDQEPERLSADDRQHLAEAMALPSEGHRLVAGSTHPGEEAMLADAYQRLRHRGIDMTLIVAPRDPQRAAEVCEIFQRTGSRAVSLTAVEATRRPSPVVVVDRIGLLRRLYVLADIAFVGGSLVDAGGHNPLEPASVAKPILFGPHTEDFRWICRTLEDAGGAIRVLDSVDLADIAIRLALDAEERHRVGQAALGIFHQHRGAVARTLATLGDDP